MALGNLSARKTPGRVNRAFLPQVRLRLARRSDRCPEHLAQLCIPSLRERALRHSLRMFIGSRRSVRTQDHSTCNYLPVEGRLVSLDSATLQFPAHLLEIHGLTVAALWYVNCPATMCEEARHAEDFCH